jgi:peptidoglycan-associated lipoprotein
MLPALMLPAVLLVTGCAYFNTYYNAQSYYNDGMRLKEQKQVGQAKGKFEKSIEKSAYVLTRWPKSRWADDATFLIGLSYYQMGHYGKAINHFERLVLAFPKSAFVSEATVHRGLSMLRLKDYGAARVLLDQVRRDYPHLRDVAAFRLAEADHLRDQHERAVDSLAAFVEQFPRSRHRSKAVYYLAESNFALGRWEEAQHWYEQAVRMQSVPKERVEAKLKVVACRLERGECEAAARLVQDVLGRFTELDDEAHLLLGKAYAEMGNTKDAIVAWSSVKGRNDIGAEAFFRIGKHHEESRDFGTARAYYDTARSRRASSDFGVLAIKRLSLLDAFAAGDSTDREPPEALFLLAEVHNLNLTEYDQAKDLYQQVYDSFPESDWAPKALFAKAWLLRNVDADSVPAETLARQVIREYPDTEYADESRRWLGLPVPKRAKKVVAPPETVAVKPSPESKDPKEPDEPGEIAELPPEMDRWDESGLPGRSRPPDRPGERPGRRPPRPDEGLVELIEEKVQTEPEPEAGDTGLSPPVPEPVPVDTVVGDPSVVPEPPVADTTAGKPQVPRERDAVDELEIVHFVTDRWDIRPDDAEALMRAAAWLKQNPTVSVTVVGHCDPRGAEAYNLGLGERRARVVRDFLLNAGIGGDRVEIRSEGERRPISTSPEEYWLDRRAAFEVR